MSTDATANTAFLERIATALEEQNRLTASQTQTYARLTVTLERMVASRKPSFKVSLESQAIAFAGSTGITDKRLIAEHLGCSVRTVQRMKELQKILDVQSIAPRRGIVTNEGIDGVSDFDDFS